MNSEGKRKRLDDNNGVLTKYFKSDRSASSTTTSNDELKLPKVVHLRRLNGKTIQDCDIYIGRSCNMGGWSLSESKWHNPYSVKEYGRQEALNRYRKYIEMNTNNLLDDLHELAGKRLGCWCKPKPCHGDILRELFQKQNVNNSTVQSSSSSKASSYLTSILCDTSSR